MKPRARKPVLGITMGDPMGVGPEVIVKALADPKIRRLADFRIFGPLDVFKRAWQLWGLKSPPPLRGGGWGEGDPGALAVTAIHQATLAALRGTIDAIVTAPISKANAHAAGFRFPGHTEYLASLCRRRKFVMMMAGPRLKVSLVTIHEPLAKVPRLLTATKIAETIRMTHTDLKNRFGLKRPRIGVAGLNPHAGEAGLFGTQEKTIITPAIRRCHRQKIDVTGPYAPDTLFHRAVNGEFDAVVAMYHDQGLIPFKLLHFEDGVNVTLGLPIIRTSVDHGTAFDIAWTGRANPASMKAAIRLAAAMVQSAQ